MLSLVKVSIPFFFPSVIKSTTFSWVDLESDGVLTSGTDKPRANLRLYAGLTTLDKTKFKADPFTAGFSTPTLLTFGTGCFSVVGAILGSVGCLAVSLTQTPWIPGASCQLPTKYPCRPQIHLQVFPGGCWEQSATVWCLGSEAIQNNIKGTGFWWPIYTDHFSL